jgi:hypothetical protein
MMPAQPKRGFGFSGLFCIFNPLFNDPNSHPAAFLAATHTLILFRLLSRTKSIICDVSGHPDPNRDALDWDGLSIP